MGRLICSKIWLFIVVVLVIVFNMKISLSAKTNDFENIYFYEYIGEELELKDIPVLFQNESVGEKVKYILDYFLEIENVICVPNETKLLDVYDSNGNIYLNFNSKILEYGGNYYETLLLEQLFRNVLSVEGVKTVTIIVNGRRTVLPEGHNIYFVDKIE